MANVEFVVLLTLRILDFSISLATEMFFIIIIDILFPSCFSLLL